ncbi:MAG: VWA domain-containing protein, partial [Isosphaeraceae bacterium]|nr:VWA domain-containing protein [Isosphaeraceae bacterium]
MEFAHPEWLLLLLAVPALTLWVARGRRRRARDWVSLAQVGSPPGDGGWGWAVAMACLIVALAGPRWGRASGPPLPEGHDVVLLIDTSRSMGAEDAVPNRLGVAVEAAESLVKALGAEPGSRVAVVAFAGRADLRIPLTENLGAAEDALRALQPGGIRPGGTNLGAGLEKALDAFDLEEHAEGRTIVLFSDGEDHADTWRLALEPLRRGRVIVHAVALGDPVQGHEVPAGGGRPLQYRGQPVLSKRCDAPLEAIARATGGVFLPLGLKSVELGPLYRDRIAPLARQRRAALHPPQRAERFGLLVLGALVIGLAGSYPYPWPMGLRWLAVLLVTLGAGRLDEPPAAAIAAGNAAYAKGDYAAALAAYRRASELDPRSPLPRYNAAATLFQLRRYEEAAGLYRKARERADAGLRTKIDFALGNTAFALGDIAGALQAYDACLASRVPGTSYDAIRRDAARNRAFVAQQPPPPSNDEEAGQPTAAAKGEPPEKAPRDGAPSHSQASGSSAPSPAGGSQGATPTGQARMGGAGGFGA